MAKSLRVLPAAEVPFDAVRLFPVSPLGPALATVFVGAWVLACAAVAFTGGIGKVNIPAALAGWAAFWIGIYWLYVVNDLRKVLKPAAWIAALGPDGVFVNCRSYRNIGRADAGAHVVLVPYSAIASARGESQSDVTGETARRVELRLVGAETSALEECLAAERDGLAADAPLGRMLWTPTTVQLDTRPALCIDWRARAASSVFLAEISRRGVLVEAQRPLGHPLPR